ncbi:MAG: toxic anion resistance protein [Eubacteriales bacterium]|nr:toxic anion resistance protein [Eubacteriales bacterium]
MNQELEQMLKEAPAPSLTLEPFPEEKKEPAVQEKQEEKAGEKVDETESLKAILTPQEQAQVDAFARQIDITNSQMVLQYGASSQKKIADFSEAALGNVRTKDLGEIGSDLSAVVSELQSFEDEDEEKGLFGFFKKNVNKLANLKAKYAKAEVNVERICKVLEEHQIQLLKDAAMLDQMYQLNLTYYKELSMYILAGKQKLSQVHKEELPRLLRRAEESGLPEDTQKAKDLAELCNRFEKKIYDLELTRTVAMQMAPQIRLIQSNDTAMSEKIQSTLVNTIPLWKSQMVLAIGVEHSAQAARAQREVTDMTNLLLKKNAETLKTATVETARESERGIVDIETLKQTNETLISTLDEMMRIQEEGRTKRREAEAELVQIEDAMRQKLMEMSRKA